MEVVRRNIDSYIRLRRGGPIREAWLAPKEVNNAAQNRHLGAICGTYIFVRLSLSLRGNLNHDSSLQVRVKCRVSDL